VSPSSRPISRAAAAAAVAAAAVAVLLLSNCAPDRPTGPNPGARSFPDAELTSTSGSVVLVGAGDIASCASTRDEQTASLMLDVLTANPTARAFAAGDLAYEQGTAAEFQNCYHPSWGQFKDRTLPATGNHEYELSPTPYFDYWNGVGIDSGVAGARTKGYYSLDLGSWHIVVLNSNHPYVGSKAGSAQDQWLQADLAASTKQCTLAISHHARFASGTTSPLPTLSQTTQAFWEDLYSAGAELAVVGHTHRYERFSPQTTMGVADPTFGVRELVVGTGGGSLGAATVIAPNSEVTNGNTFGVMKLTLNDGGYHWEFLPIAGSTFSDSGSANCHGKPPANIKPVSRFAKTCTGLSCQFTDQSTDADGILTQWMWYFGDGQTATAKHPSHTYAGAGTYTVSHTVWDSRGATNTSSQTVTVAAPSPNQPPVASFSYSCTNLSCGFDGTGSADADGSIAAYSWAFGDAATGSGVTTTHAYASAGTFTVTLTVTDNLGAANAVSKSVSVTAPVASGITLSARGYKVKGVQRADLKWSGATGSTVSLFRNGARIAEPANTTTYTDVIGAKGPGTYIYKVCNTGTSTCSPNATVVF
jgi:PKD repeat protein